MDNLTNFNCPGIVYSNGCTTTPLDIYKAGTHTFDIPYVMSSAYTVAGLYGGVAYIGNSILYRIYMAPNIQSLFLDCIVLNQKIGIAKTISKFKFPVNSYVNRYYQMYANQLIGDPELTMWRQSPQDLNVSMIWGDNSIGVSGSYLDGSKIVINDGEGAIRVMDVNYSASFILPYIHGNDTMEAIGIYKIGYLPKVSINCFNNQINDCNKEFVVRDAIIGERTGLVDIGSGASISIRAVDYAKCGSSLVVSTGGILSISSDDKALIEGSQILEGGRISIKAGKVEIKNGFEIKKGGCLTVNNI